MNGALANGRRPMTVEVSTVGGNLILAATRRDNDSYNLWRADLNLDESGQQTLLPLIYEVFRELVTRRFESLENVLRLQVITYLVEEMPLTDEQVVKLIAESERWVAENS